MISYMKFYWKQNLLLFTIIVVGALAQVMAGVLNARAFNALIAFDWSEFIQVMLMILALLFVYIVSLLIRIPYETKVTQLMVTKIRTDVMSQLEDVSYEEYHKYQSGTFVSWITNDINTIEQNGFSNVYTLMTMTVEMIFAAIALLFFHWSIIVYSVIVSVITILLPKLVKNKVRNSVIEYSKQQEKFVSTVTSVIKGFDTLFSYNLVSRITNSVKNASQDLADKRVKQQRAMTYSAVLGASGNLFGQAGVLILTGYLAFRRIVTIGAITATESLSNTIFNGLGNITNVIVEIQTVQPIFEKFNSITAIDKSHYLPFHKSNNEIDLENVTYKYGEKPLWKNITYHFKGGRKYAIVGPSGTGKTTLLNILNGKLNDYEGSVQFSANELKTIDGYQLRQEVIYLDQSPYIFDGSILENVTLGDNFTNDQIWDALEAAGLKSDVKSLDKQLDSPVGEDGRLLSGGQKQRLTLARGFIRGKKVILIDEGTSSLDNDTAIEIEENLVKNEELTVIMVTHHLRDQIASQLDGILDLSTYIL